MIENEKKKKLIYILVGSFVALVLAGLLALASYNRYKDLLIDVTAKEALHFFLLDGFSFSFLFFLCFYLFAYISYKEHFFAMLSFAFKKYGTALLPRRMKINTKLPKNYGDYLEELRAKPVPYYSWIFFSSLTPLLGAIICGIIYMINPVTVSIG